MVENKPWKAALPRYRIAIIAAVAEAFAALATADILRLLM